MSARRPQDRQDMTGLPAFRRPQRAADRRDSTKAAPGDRRSMTIVAPFDREWRRRVINEEVFSTAVHRERKRADRGHESLFLLRITIHDESAGAPATWARVIDAVTSVTRRSDVLGWCTTDAVLGLLVPEVRPSDG